MSPITRGTTWLLLRGSTGICAPHVFSREVGDAHVLGDLHLHGLGYIDRPYSSWSPWNT
jgi:ribonucleoside-triphosphate reductase